MDVIERIERGGLHLLAVDRGYNIVIDQSKGGSELVELLRLAKLGAIAVKVFDSNDPWGTDSPCPRDEFGSAGCNDTCMWYDFCKLRQEVQP